jgi:hypothetical protein
MLLPLGETERSIRMTLSLAFLSLRTRCEEFESLPVRPATGHQSATYSTDAKVRYYVHRSKAIFQRRPAKV